jgi:hypothetical protein
MPRECYVRLSDEAVRLHRLAAAEYKVDLRTHLELCLEADAAAYAVELGKPPSPALVQKENRGRGVTVMLTCVACGCTDFRACATEEGACYWVEESPPVCSACASPWPRIVDRARIVARIQEEMAELAAA